ncbi:MAG: hypothetical protein K8R49_00265 [Candidatus Cloacimonetes bacterium]|nr:hypothetical protein [Candidatus Cloacimonadota bacterium]
MTRKNDDVDPSKYKIIRKVKVRQRVNRPGANSKPFILTVGIIFITLILAYIGINILLYLLDIVF